MCRPRLLFVCHRFPYPPKRGGKIRPFNILRHLQQRADVTVASLVRSPEEAAEAQGIAGHCSEFLLARIGPAAALGRMLWRLPTATPSSLGNFYSPELARLIRQRARETPFDLAFVHCSSAAQYVLPLTGLPKVLDFGDMDSEKWSDYAKWRRFPLSAGYWLEGRKLRREEARLAAAVELATCTTRAELASLEALGTARATGWFPNGVDAEFFSPADDYDPDTICFAGRMDYFPNQQAVHWLVGEILPRIRRRRPGARLLVVGAEPPAAIRRYASDPGVEVTGTVPDVRPYVRSAALSLAPLRIARGTQNKILESAAMAVPVVTTRCAAGGVDMQPGEHILVADDADGLAAAALELLADPDRRAELAAAARARVLSHHAWTASMRRLDALLDRHFPGLLPAAGGAGA